VKIYGNTFVNMGGATRIGSDGGSGNEAYNNIFYGPQGVDFATFSHDFNACGGGTSCSEANSQSITDSVFTDYNGLDYRLSMATGKGKALPAQFETDLIGSIRGADGTWDIGAYEYVSGPSCIPDWICAAWSSCVGGQQTRTCSDSRNCGTMAGKPQISQTCSSCTPSAEVCGNGADEDCDGSDLACLGELIYNGEFEAYTDGIANGWKIVPDGSIKYIASEDIGHSGNAQRIQVTGAGSWGLFMYQKPDFQVGKSYNWTFWYRTQGGKLAAEISDPPADNRILQRNLTDTAGQWKQISIHFKYTNPVANQLRFSTGVVGDYWIDDVMLKEGCISADCDGCMSQNELLQYIQQWKTGSISLAQLMEAIRQWKEGC
jgi:hypothetical protein